MVLRYPKYTENHDIYVKTEQSYLKLRAKIAENLIQRLFYVNYRDIDRIEEDLLGKGNEELLAYQKALQEERNTRL